MLAGFGSLRTASRKHRRAVDFQIALNVASRRQARDGKSPYFFLAFFFVVFLAVFFAAFFLAISCSPLR